MSNQYQNDCLRKVAKIAARHLDTLTASDRIMVCEGIASLYPSDSEEAKHAIQHAEALRVIDRQQLLLKQLLQS